MTIVQKRLESVGFADVKLISLFEEEMYDRKEKLVERLQELTE